MDYCVGAIIAPGLKGVCKLECYESVEKKNDGKRNKCDSKNEKVK